MGLPPEINEVLGELRTRWPWVAGFALVVFLITLAARCGSGGETAGPPLVPREAEAPAASRSVLADRPVADRDFEGGERLPEPQRMALPRAVTDPLLPGPREYRLDEAEYGDQVLPQAPGAAVLAPTNDPAADAETDEMRRILEGGERP